MLRIFLVIFSITLLANIAQAGPWLREKGSAFTATSVSATYFLDTTSQTYLEYGFTDKTTFVGELSLRRLRYASEIGSATASMRRALSHPGAKSKWAYEFGVGAGWEGQQVLPHLRTGLSWGRGIKWTDKSGWATVETSIIWDITYARYMAKVDTTLGINFTDVTAGMLQFYTMHMADKTSATFAPSVIFSPKKSKFRIVIGAETPLKNMSNTALKLGLWREF